MKYNMSGLSIVVAGITSIALSVCVEIGAANADPPGDDQNAVITAYQLTQFDLATCQHLTPELVPETTFSLSQKICGDAQQYQAKLVRLAAAHQITLPTELPYELKAGVFALVYHPSPSVNVQYLQSQVDSHQEALAVLEDESSNGRDPEIKAFDQRALLVVQGNTQALQEALLSAETGRVSQRDFQYKDTP